MDLAYSFAPRLLSNQLEDVFDLSSSRYHKIKDSIEKNLRKNKEQIKTESIGLIDSVLTKAGQKALSTDEIKKIFLSGKSLQSKFVGLMKSSFEEVLAAMTREELHNMKEYSQDKFKKTEERLADPEKFKKEALKSFEKNMETFFDSVTDGQRQMYSDFVLQNQDFYKMQFESRRAFVSKFESIFDNKPELLNYVLKYYSGDDSTKTSDYIKKQSQFFDKMYVAAGAIWQSLSDRQHENLKKNLTKMKSDISQL